MHINSFLLLIFLILPNVLQSKPLDKIALQLKWTHAFQFAGYYAAKEQGYYKEAGLDVDIIEASPSTDPIKNVLDGKAQYGVGTSSLLLEYAKQKPLVVLAVIFQQSPYEIHTTGDILTIQGLIGKRLMLEPQSDELLAYLQKEGIPLNQITIIPHSFNPSDLMNGKTDAMSGYVSNEPFYYHKQNFSFQTFTPRSAGIDFYGDNLFTTRSEIASHPERVKAFREASMRGWQYAKEHHEEMIELIIKKYAPHLSNEYLHYESAQMIPLLQPDLIEIGYMNPARWKHIADTYVSIGLMSKNYNLDEFIYHESQESFPKWLIISMIAAGVVIFLTSAVLIYVIRLNRRLSESQQRFRTLFQNSPIGMIMVDYESGRFLEANTTVLDVSGYSYEEYLQLTFKDVTSKDFHDQMNTLFQEVGEREYVGPIEKECLRKDGSRYFVRARCFLTHDRHNRKQIWAFIEDLSEQKKIEESLKLSKVKYEHLVENIAGEYCFYIHDTQGVVTYVSPSIVDMLGYTADEAKAHYEDFITDHPLNCQIVASTEAALRGEKQSTYLAQFRHKDGTTRWIEVNESPMFSEQGDVIGVEGIMHNVNALKESEFKLNLAASVFTNAKEGIAITDSEGIIVDVNQAYERQTGYTKEELIGKNSSILQSGRQSKEFYSDMWQKLLNQGHWSGEIWNRRKNGALYAQILTISAVYDLDSLIMNFVGLTTDITSIKEHQKELETIAHYDTLTSLPNRLLLSDRLSQAIASANRRSNILAVIFIDLDGFKPVNDTLGHDAGDELLRLLSKEMQTVLREEDTLARIGGDEFVGVITNLGNQDECKKVLDRLIEIIQTPFLINAATVQVSASIGVAFYPDDGIEADILLRKADQAMYSAKQSGKNRYHIFEYSLQ